MWITKPLLGMGLLVLGMAGGLWASPFHWQSQGGTFWRMPLDGYGITWHDGFYSDNSVTLNLTPTDQVRILLHLENTNVSNGYLVSIGMFPSMTFSHQEPGLAWSIGDMGKRSFGYGLLLQDEAFYGLSGSMRAGEIALRGLWASTGYTGWEDLQVLSFEPQSRLWGGFITFVGTEKAELLPSHAFINVFGQTDPGFGITLRGELSGRMAQKPAFQFDGTASLLRLAWQGEAAGFSCDFSRSVRHYSAEYLAPYVNLGKITYRGFDEYSESFENFRNFILDSGETWGHAWTCRIKKQLAPQVSWIYDLENMAILRSGSTLDFAFFNHQLIWEYSPQLTWSLVMSNRIAETGISQYSLQVPAREYLMLKGIYRIHD